MPDSVTKENDLGYFIKNETIETYSYVTPTLFGELNFDKFLDFSFSFFSDGKEYFIIKHFSNKNLQRNSKIMRQRKFIPFYLDISLMTWKSEKKNYLSPTNIVKVDSLEPDELERWIDVFFDAFEYPPRLEDYITKMVLTQEKNGVNFYVGTVSKKDVSCFCTFKQENYIGFYGIGTKHYMTEISENDPSTSFCLQVLYNSGAEKLYELIGFERFSTQKRFDWDPSTHYPAI
jgi:hypothetical protein